MKIIRCYFIPLKTRMSIFEILLFARMSVVKLLAFRKGFPCKDVNLLSERSKYFRAARITLLLSRTNFENRNFT